MGEVTQILRAIEAGEASATEQLLSIVYDELRRIASAKLAHEKAGQTLRTTALVHEAYLRLLRPPDGKRTSDQSLDANHDAVIGGASLRSRGHFFAAAAEAMRRILIDNARARNRIKRGGNQARVELDGAALAIPAPSVDLLALDDALTRLQQEDEMKATVVKLRYFAGLTIEQTADALNVSEPTIKRHWYYARAWLKREIGE